MPDSTYPGTIDDPRTDWINAADAETGLRNLSGYDGEDPDGEGAHAGALNLIGTALIALEATLGLTPQGASATVKARLEAIEAAIATKATTASAATKSELTAAVTAINETLTGKQNALGFTAANLANLDNDVTLAADSATKWPTNHAVRAFVAAAAAAATSGAEVAGTSLATMNAHLATTDPHGAAALVATAVAAYSARPGSVLIAPAAKDLSYARPEADFVLWLVDGVAGVDKPENRQLLDLIGYYSSA